MRKNFYKTKTVIMVIALLSSFSLCACNNAENEESSNLLDESSQSSIDDISTDIQVSIGGIEEDSALIESSKPLVSVPTDEEKLESDIIESSRLLEEVTKLGSKVDDFYKVINSNEFTIKIDEDLFGDKLSFFITREGNDYYIEFDDVGKLLYKDGEYYRILDDEKKIIDIGDSDNMISTSDLIPDYNGYTFKSAKNEDYNGKTYYCETYTTNDALYTSDKRTELGVEEVGELKFYFTDDTPEIMVYTYTEYDDVSVINISEFSNKADKSYFELPSYKHITVDEYMAMQSN